jgi:hypothetical protein
MLSSGYLWAQMNSCQHQHQHQQMLSSDHKLVRISPEEGNLEEPGEELISKVECPGVLLWTILDIEHIEGEFTVRNIQNIPNIFFYFKAFTLSRKGTLFNSIRFYLKIFDENVALVFSSKAWFQPVFQEIRFYFFLPQNPSDFNENWYIVRSRADDDL